jgi:uncharacterized protein (DUF1501 family)
MIRREFLKTGSAALALASMGGAVTALSAMQAQAADTTGYKALVCVFLFGGMDNYDTIIPYDSTSYQRWAQIRASLVNAQGTTRQRAQLRPLTPSNQNDFGARRFALPPEFSGIHQLFQSGDAAIVGNVGPLIEPTTAAQFEDQTVSLPLRLFSHNDQQSTWMSGATEGAQFGWGGLFSDQQFSAGANSSTTFANITTGGNELFLTGPQTAPYNVTNDGAVLPYVIDNEDLSPSVRDRLVAHFRGEAYGQPSLLGRDLANKMRSAYDANAQYNQAAGTVVLNSAFPESGLGRQLQIVARTIAARHQLGTRRQIFGVSLGGFDTHDNQAASLPALQQQVDAAVVAFHTSMVDLGLNNDVTLFTASDFGRTLALNGDGTDHGWGGHHFVIGGGVNGQRIIGDIPPADFGHALDAGSGRLIPTMAVDQYAAQLGQWYGLNASELVGVFPQLGKFSPVASIFA